MDQMAQAAQLVKASAATKKAKYVLHWTGSKIPRGAKVGGVSIGWTQHGRVTGTGGEELGFYDRTLEFGGPEGNEHEMIVSADAQVTDTQGQPCPQQA